MSRKTNFQLFTLISFLGVVVAFCVFPIVLRPWDSPVVSPDGRFEIRYFETLSLRRVLGLVSLGDGTRTAGYVELYDKKRQIRVGSKFVNDLASQEPRWFDDEVFLPEPGGGWKYEPAE